MATSEQPLSSYIDKLKDPRWQRKRLEILQRDNWMCQRCENTTETLTVHHRTYLPDHDPWDYPPELLVTLCEPCHKAETITWPLLTESIIPFLKERMWGDDVADLIRSFCNLPYRDLEHGHIDAFRFITHWLMEKPHDMGLVITLGAQYNPWVLKELTDKYPRIAQLVQETWEALVEEKQNIEQHNANN